MNDCENSLEILFYFILFFFKNFTTIWLLEYKMHRAGFSKAEIEFEFVRTPMEKPAS